MSYDLLASAVNHPDRIRPLWGLFNHRSLHALTQVGVDVTATVPRPRAPPVGPYSEYRQIPGADQSFTYPVFHPRFLYYLPKSLLYHRTGDSMASALSSWHEDRVGDFDVFHGCHLYPDGYALQTATASGRTVTAYTHGTIINEFDSFNRPTQRRISETLASLDRVFCSGEAIRQRALEIEPSADAETVPIGANPANFPTESREQLREELKIPADATVVLFCGHLTEKKGVRDLLNVLPDLDTESLYLVFIGHGGDLRTGVQRALCRPDSPPGKLQWQLHPVAVRRWFAAADLLVLPSYSEGRPTVIYEAMASQTPVLATEVGGVPEQVDAGTTGWLIDPGDTETLRARLNTLPAEKLPRMGIAAEQRLREEGWTWDAHARSIRRAHRNLLATGLTSGPPAQNS
jgi:glycosyltransferase involved in cell wall biosynthesis